MGRRKEGSGSRKQEGRKEGRKEGVQMRIAKLKRLASRACTLSAGFGIRQSCSMDPAISLMQGLKIILSTS